MIHFCNNCFEIYYLKPSLREKEKTFTLNKHKKGSEMYHTKNYFISDANINILRECFKIRKKKKKEGE